MSTPPTPIRNIDSEITGRLLLPVTASGDWPPPDPVLAPLFPAIVPVDDPTPLDDPALVPPLVPVPAATPLPPLVPVPAATPLDWPLEGALLNGPG